MSNPGWTFCPAHRTPLLPTSNSCSRRFATSQLDIVGTADTPLAQFVPELMELYPEAKVICTVRDPDAWARSMEETASTSLQAFLSILVFWVPCLRYFPKYLDLLQDGRYGELYLKPGESKKVLRGRAVWERHMEYLEQVVPKDRLFFFTVKDGWQPLCEVLGIEVPPDLEFPRINDGKAIERLAKEQIQKGVARWMIVISIAFAAGVVLWRLW